MRLASAMPAVCSAIGSKKFEEFAGVSAIERTGPAQGANVYFRFLVCVRKIARRISQCHCQDGGG